VFRVRTKPIEEAQLLADYAIEGLGARRFAILYPRDSYGRGLRALFWDAVEVRGGSVVGVASYDPEATDFAEPIRRLVGYVLLTPKEHEALGEREKMLKRARRLPPDEALALRQKAMEFTAADGAPIPPIVDFDALFIPESHEKVVLIAPQLAFHEATGITLLGPQGWYAPDLVEIGRTHVEGAHFTAYFYPDSPIPYVREFAERFQAGFGRPAGVFAAQGYDAANLVLVQLARGIGSRPGVRDGILYTRAFPGVTGVMSMRPDGNASKRPFLLGVERGRITQIEQGVAAPR
jgi:ABC-type branched-subunit amino acid transport system substrate-binding protein